MTFEFLLHDVLGRFNYVDRLEGLISSIWHGDYNRKKGVTGVILEFSRSVSGANLHRFSVPRRGSHSLNEVEALLQKYGVIIFGRTHDGACMHFNVKRRQARWAEYLMLHAGVDLVGPLFDKRNASYANRHTAGWMPMPWSESGRTMQPPESFSASSILDPIIGSGRKSSTELSVEVNRHPLGGGGKHHPTEEGGPMGSVSHHKSVPARTPGGWLEQLDAFWENL